MNKILKVLHIGVGNRGTWPLEHCKSDIGFEPAALCDVNPSLLEEARKKTALSEEACFTELDKALITAKVDCAIVCVPTAFHATVATKLMVAGIPTLMEKGMAPDWKSACELVREAKQRGAILAIAQNYRYQPTERTIWRAIHDPKFIGYVGKVHQASYSQQRVRPNPRTLTYPFASVWDMSCHHFDNMHYWLGSMKEMTAFAWRAEWSAYEHPSNTSAHIVFQNGTCVHYIHTHDAARNTLDIEIHGERGAVFLRDGHVTFNERPLKQLSSTPIQNLPLEDTHGERDMLIDFHKYICEGKEPGISASHNLETMAACEMMVRSISTKSTCQRIELDKNK